MKIHVTALRTGFRRVGLLVVALVLAGCGASPDDATEVGGESASGATTVAGTGAPSTLDATPATAAEPATECPSTETMSQALGMTVGPGESDGGIDTSTVLQCLYQTPDDAYPFFGVGFKVEARNATIDQANALLEDIDRECNGGCGREYHTDDTPRSQLDYDWFAELPDGWMSVDVGGPSRSGSNLWSGAFDIVVETPDYACEVPPLAAHLYDMDGVLGWPDVINTAAKNVLEVLRDVCRSDGLGPPAQNPTATQEARTPGASPLPSWIDANGALGTVLAAPAPAPDPSYVVRINQNDWSCAAWLSQSACTDDEQVAFQRAGTVLTASGIDPTSDASSAAMLLSGAMWFTRFADALPADHVSGPDLRTFIESTSGFDPVLDWILEDLGVDREHVTPEG